MQSCKNKEDLSNVSISTILLTLFDLVFDFKKVAMRSAYEVHKWEENLYN